MGQVQASDGAHLNDRQLPYIQIIFSWFHPNCWNAISYRWDPFNIEHRHQWQTGSSNLSLIGESICRMISAALFQLVMMQNYSLRRRRRKRSGSRIPADFLAETRFNSDAMIVQCVVQVNSSNTNEICVWCFGCSAHVPELTHQSLTNLQAT